MTWREVGRCGKISRVREPIRYVCGNNRHSDEDRPTDFVGCGRVGEGVRG
jgi:hypothetical protein